MGRKGVAVTFLEDEARDMEFMKQVEKEFNMPVELVTLDDKETFEEKVHTWLKESDVCSYISSYKWIIR